MEKKWWEETPRALKNTSLAHLGITRGPQYLGELNRPSHLYPTFRLGRPDTSEYREDGCTKETTQEKNCEAASATTDHDDESEKKKRKKKNDDDDISTMVMIAAY